jgi:hypothetical protein
MQVGNNADAARTNTAASFAAYPFPHSTMFATATSTEKFSDITPGQFYDMYMDATLLAELTGAPAHTGQGVGEAYNAYGGYCYGKNLLLVPGKLIVQTWQANGFVDQESILVLAIEAHGDDTYCNLTEAQADGMAEKWSAFYWDKYRAHIAGEAIPAAPMMQ